MSRRGQSRQAPRETVLPVVTEVVSEQEQIVLAAGRCHFALNTLLRAGEVAEQMFPECADGIRALLGTRFESIALELQKWEADARGLSA